MKRIKNCLLLVFIIIGIISCRDKEKFKDSSMTLNYTVKKTLGTILQIPDSLKTYTPFSTYVADSTQMSTSFCKIYTYINASCPTCVEDIKKWDRIVDKAINHNVVVFMIFHSDDNFELLKHACETRAVQNFRLPFFLDTEGEYLSKNSFMKESKHLETVLTNAENNIILHGNPLASDEIERSYFSEIQKRSKKLFGGSRVIMGKPIKNNEN